MKQLAIDFTARASAPGSGSAKTPVRHPGRGQLHPEVYSRDEVLAMLEGPLGRNEKTRCRNRALLIVMWRAGLRVSEALGLRACDLRPDDGGVWVRAGKGGKSRLAAMDAEAFASLRPWLVLRVGLGVNADPKTPFFCTFEGRAVEPSYVRHMLGRLRAKAGLAKRVHAHAFRHTHAHELWREGVAERIIQLQLGHASLAATDKYLQEIGSREVVNAVSNRPPWHALATEPA